MSYTDIVARRRAFHIPGYATLADAGFEGDWVTPYQKASRSPTGPVLIAYNWLDAPSVDQHRDALQANGFLPGMIFNKVVDKALALRGLTRPDIYVTQVFHLLPMGRSESVPTKHADASFAAVTKHELIGRKVVALGDAAAGTCRRHGVPCEAVRHPSARGLSLDERAAELAAALQRLGF